MIDVARKEKDVYKLLRALGRKLNTDGVAHMPAQIQLQPQGSLPQLGMRLMCSQNQNEVELVRNELVKAGISSETRPHAVAEKLGFSAVELWVHNERDFFDASELYARLRNQAKSPQVELSTRPVSGRQPQPDACITPPMDVSIVDSPPVAHPVSLELKQAGSLLHQGIEEMFLRGSKLAEECAALSARVEELKQALAQAQADVVQEIKRREAAERVQAEQTTGLLGTFERERWEWQQKLESSDDLARKAQEQVDSLSGQLQAQQAEDEALRQEIVSLQCQRDQQEAILSNARTETIAERQARIAAEQRASLAEQSLDTEWMERQELERRIQNHVAGLGSLLARVSSKAADGSDKT